MGRGYDNIVDFQFSRNNKRYGFLAQKENWKWVAVIDGQESKKYFEIVYGSLKFTEDSKNFVDVSDNYFIENNNLIFFRFEI